MFEWDKCKRCKHIRATHEGDDGERKGYCTFTEEDLVTDCECEGFVEDKEQRKLE